MKILLFLMTVFDAFLKVVILCGNIFIGLLKFVTQIFVVTRIIGKL